MTPARLLLRSLVYHWRGNLAVLLGVVVGTAVLTGALLVGDSQRGSLRELALRRLGWIDHAMITPRFFREELARDISEAASPVCPALIFQGTISATVEGEPRSARKVTVFGVDIRFLPGQANPWLPAPGESPEVVFLNSTVAQALGVKEGDRVTLHLQKQHNIPRETLLGRRTAEDVEERLPLTARVLPADAPGAGIALTPGPESPRNAFVPLALLQDRLSAGRNREGEILRGRVNAILTGEARGDLQQALARKLQLSDWGLTLRKMEKSDEVSLESRRLILEPAVGDAVRSTRFAFAPTLVNMADTIALKDADSKEVEIPYSVVAAVDVNDPNSPGALEKTLREKVGVLNDNQIVLTTWEGRPLKADRGAPVRVKYYQPDDGGKLELREESFTLAAVLPMEGPLDDPGLVPQVRGITDRPPLQWEPPFPYDRERMRKAGGNSYWTSHKTAPRGYVTLAKGEKLWKSRFGDRTSYRLRGTEAEIDAALRQALKPAEGGFVFEAIKENALKASSGGTDFALLFLGFSFFLILAALLLVGLLFRLNLDQRSREVGVLIASGLRLSTIRWLLLGEGCLLSLLGALVGTGVAILYGDWLLGRLRAWWPGGLDASVLQLHVTPTSLAIGGGAALVVSVLTIAWAVRVLSKIAPRALIQGQTVEDATPSAAQPRRSVQVAIVSLVGGLACLVAGLFIKGHEARAGTFFGSGMLFLVAGLAGLRAWMRRSRHGTVSGGGASAVALLGVRNAARYPARSLLTAGLLASAAFLLVGVESFRRRPGQDYLSKESGSGGYALLAESDLPLFADLNTPAGRDEVLKKLEQRWNELQVPPAEREKRLADAGSLLEQLKVAAFRVREGDDASCLNLYQPRRPRVLGVPRSLRQERGFAFSSVERKAENPWDILEDSSAQVPVFGEQNTVVWMLKSGLGDVLEVPDWQGRPRQARIAGLLHDSVFQSGLLVSEDRLLELYPGEQGYRFFLIRVPAGRETDVKRLLETALWDRGFEVTPTADRLAAYLAVENMYLSTFQALGGLGLLLGTLGLAVVLLRSVWERRGELALLRALGFRGGTLGWLVLAENGFLLLAGLGMGLVAALLSVAPHVLGAGGSVAWVNLLGMLGLALVVGLLASSLATAVAVRGALLPALRRE